MTKVYKLFSAGIEVVDNGSWATVFKKANSLISTQPNVPFFVLEFELSPVELTVISTLTKPKDSEYVEAVVPVGYQDDNGVEKTEVMSFKIETQAFFGHYYQYWTKQTPKLKWVYPQIESIF